MIRILTLSLAFSALLSLPTLAWEARAGQVCELAHEGPGGSVLITYDPRIPEYAISVRSTATAWPAGPVFVMRFDGGRTVTIQTNRHSLSDGGQTLTVRDRGFGNVLNGLEFNETATAYLGDLALPFALTGPAPAAPAVAQFRACAGGGIV